VKSSQKNFYPPLSIDKVNDNIIFSGSLSSVTHTLVLKNSASFDESLLNGKMPNQKRRASSFDLVLFRIPKTSGSTGNVQYWDEGVGYDYTDYSKNLNSGSGGKYPTVIRDDNSFAKTPSNWYNAQTLSGWTESGIYNSKNEGNVNYSGLTIIDTQHFEFGNEDVSFNMTNEINAILSGSTTSYAGWGIAYPPSYENATGLTESYSVGFFSRHTQTFYEPYLLTTYDDLIKDDRNNFVKNRINKLYLYVTDEDSYSNLDNNPIVNIFDNDGIVVGASNLSTKLITKGVYEVSVPNVFSGRTSPMVFTDVWSGMTLNGITLPNVENEFVLYDMNNRIKTGTKTTESETYNFDFYNIMQGEKILNTDVRKIGVIIKKAYSTSELLTNIKGFYRVYVKEGETQVQVQDWTEFNRTPNEYYFNFDTRDKIPNKYFIDLKVQIAGEITTYKKQLHFFIVNKK
jgi:ASC-1-like (ASCH) protein